MFDNNINAAAKENILLQRFHHAQSVIVNAIRHDLAVQPVSSFTQQFPQQHANRKFTDDGDGNSTPTRSFLVPIAVAFLYCVPIHIGLSPRGIIAKSTVTVSSIYQNNISRYILLQLQVKLYHIMYPPTSVSGRIYYEWRRGGRCTQHVHPSIYKSYRINIDSNI